MSTQATVVTTNVSFFAAIKKRYLVIAALVGLVYVSCVAVYFYNWNTEVSLPAPSPIRVDLPAGNYSDSVSVSLAFDDGRKLSGVAKAESQSKRLGMDDLGKTLSLLLTLETSVRWAPIEISGSDRKKTWTSVATERGDEKTLDVRFRIYP